MSFLLAMADLRAALIIEMAGRLTGGRTLLRNEADSMMSGTSTLSKVDGDGVSSLSDMMSLLSFSVASTNQSSSVLKRSRRVHVHSTRRAGCLQS